MPIILLLSYNFWEVAWGIDIASLLGWTSELKQILSVASHCERQPHLPCAVLRKSHKSFPCIPWKQSVIIHEIRNSDTMEYTYVSEFLMSSVFLFCFCLHESYFDFFILELLLLQILENILDAFCLTAVNFFRKKIFIPLDKLNIIFWVFHSVCLVRFFFILLHFSSAAALCSFFFFTGAHWGTWR